MRVVLFHSIAREEIRKLTKTARNQLGDLFYKLQIGINLAMPDSRPMPDIFVGVHELRISDSSGIYRVFYYTKSERGILVFYAVTKKTQKTAERDMKLAKKRLLEMLKNEN